MTDYTALKKAQAELKQFLEENPEMYKMQLYIDKNIEHLPAPELRLMWIENEMVFLRQQAAEALETLYQELDKLKDLEIRAKNLRRH